MPNPIPVLMSSPGTVAKPGATSKDISDTQGGAIFQMVMDEAATAHPNQSETPEQVVQNPDAALELETVTEEGAVEDDLAVVPVSPEDQQPTETRPVAPDGAQEPVARMQAEVSLVTVPAVNTDTHPAAESNPKPVVTTDTRSAAKAEPAHAVKAETEMAAKAQPVVVQTEVLQPQRRSSQSQIAPVVQALIVGSAPPTKTPEVAPKPQSLHSATAAPEAHTEDAPKLAPHPRGESDEPDRPAVPQAARPQTATPDRAQTFVQMQLLASENPGAQTETKLVPEIEELQLPRESSAVASSRDPAPLAQSMTATARAETARAVANQMATVISARGQPGTVEVALNPEELGRVSIVLNGREDGLHMTISAERPETLDMMRRHISVLETEFQSFGFGNLSFDLGTSAGSQQEDSENNDSAGFSDIHPEQIVEAGPAVPKLGPDGRIDIRL